MRREILFDSIIFGLQRIGGISNYWEQLLNHALSSPEITPSIILPDRVIAKSFAPDRFLDVTTVREVLPCRFSRYMRAYSKAGSVFHTSYYRTPRGGVEKYVVTVYDFTYERYRRGLPRLAHNIQKLASIRRADEVICISDYTRQDVLEFCPEVDPDRVHVVPLAVDHARYFEEAVLQTEEPSEVLFVGRRGGYKRFDLAVEGVRRASTLQLGIVGPMLTVEEQALLQSTLAGRWTYHGAVSVSHLRRLYAGAFCFVFPSDYEGFGLPTLEAMACGCPVVSSNAASLPEVGGTAALYAATQSGDAYAHAFDALRQPGARARLVSSGLARSKEFTWHRTCKLTFDIYGTRG